MIDQDKRLHLLALYAQVASLFPGLNVSLAGGYPRDVILGREVKDIDVVVDGGLRHMEVEDARDAMKQAAELAGAGGFETTSESHYNDGDGRSYATYELTSPNFPAPLNIIFASDINVFLNGHPDTLSQVSVEADDVYVSEGFVQSVERKKVYTRLQLYEPRVQRLSQKYPEYEWEYLSEGEFGRRFGAWV